MRRWVGSCQNDADVTRRPFSGTLNMQNEQWHRRSERREVEKKGGREKKSGIEREKAAEGMSE